jgi:hypothetical protein
MGDIYYGLQELKRVIGNNLNKIANDLDVAADMEETEMLEIEHQNMATFLRQYAEEKLFSQTPPRYEGNVIDLDEHVKRRG